MILTESAAAAAANVDQQRLWQRHLEMAKIGAIPGNGVNRQALTAEDIEARRRLVSWAASPGIPQYEGHPLESRPVPIGAPHARQKPRLCGRVHRVKLPRGFGVVTTMPSMVSSSFYSYRNATIGLARAVLYDCSVMVANAIKAARVAATRNTKRLMLVLYSKPKSHWLMT